MNQIYNVRLLLRRHGYKPRLIDGTFVYNGDNLDVEAAKRYVEQCAKTTLSSAIDEAEVVKFRTNVGGFVITATAEDLENPK